MLHMPFPFDWDCHIYKMQDILGTSFLARYHEINFTV